MNLSSTERWTRILDRAQQSCPALSNTAYGAVAAARSRSQSAKMMLALLPPSSSVSRFTCRAHPAMIERPTSVDPVKTILRTARVVDQPLPDHAALARQHGEHPLRQARLQGQLADPHRGQRGGLGGLGHDGAARGQRGRHAPGQDRHREVPRHDQAHHADRLVERDVQPAGHRDLLADEPFRRRGVVQQHVADLAGLPARGPDRVAGAGHLQPGQLLEMLVHQPKANARSRRARSPGATARQAGQAAAARAMASSACSADAMGTVVTGSSVAGLSTVNVDMRGLPVNSRSKPRRSSQSVTAAS